VNFSIFIRKERWTLSWRGKLLAGAVIFSLAFFVCTEVHPFLAVHHPKNADLMVVESWITSNYLLKEAAVEFQRGNYRKILILRSTYPGDDDTEETEPPARFDEKHVSRALANYGVPCQDIATKTYSAVEKDRTYHAALSTKEWIFQNGGGIRGINVVTVGPHARRSWLMFDKVFGNDAEVGVVTLQDPTYDPKHWWRTSEGVREILGETIAYVYARFFFTWLY
jgi:uncharacterized SAM-binding protein YcdF (DUF218 family)